MAVFLRKLLGIGKLPDDLRAEVEAEGIIQLTEYVAVTRRFSGRVPGKRSKGEIASYVGSLVLTNQRVLGTLSSVPKLAGRTIDQPWDAPHRVLGQVSRADATAPGALAFDVPPSSCSARSECPTTPRTGGSGETHFSRELRRYGIRNPHRRGKGDH